MQHTFFGELATTVATTNKKLENNKNRTPIIEIKDNFFFVDTNKKALDYISATRTNAKIIDISNNGTAGGQHAKGFELGEKSFDKVKDQLTDDTQILWGCLGGGNFGVLIATAAKLENEGKKVIIFCFDLWSSDNQESNRLENRTQSIKALQSFSHCFIELQKESLIGCCEAVKGALDKLNTIVGTRAVDDKDFANCMSNKSQFCLVQGESLGNQIGEKMAMSKILNQVKLFSNRNNSKIKNYILVAGTVDGSLEPASQTKTELNYLLDTSGKGHTKAIPTVSDNSSYIILATI